MIAALQRARKDSAFSSVLAPSMRTVNRPQSVLWRGSHYRMAKRVRCSDKILWFSRVRSACLLEQAAFECLGELQKPQKSSKSYQSHIGIAEIQ